MDLFWSYVHPIIVWFVCLVDFVVSTHSIPNNWDLLIQIHIKNIHGAYLLRCRWRMKFTPGQKARFKLSASHFSSAFDAYLTTTLSHPMHKNSRTSAAGVPITLVIGTSQDACFWTDCRHPPWVHNWDGHPHRMTDQLLAPSACRPEAGCGRGIK